MNRPEPIELENNLGPDAVTGEINRVPWMAYDVDEMDIYIAEKDKEIAELKQKLEDAKASHYAEMVDAGMRERRLRRALYNACANWAKCEERINNRDAYDASEYLPSAEDKFRKKAERWSEIERKCRAKAEEYK
jgi:hypothetical protein